nr:hypothetical protein [Tanacetum cinerariifolium]
MNEGGDSNDIRSTYDEINEEDEVFQSYYTESDSFHYVKDADSPKIGSEYSTIDKCIEMYAKYAKKSGFTIRKSTQEKLKSGMLARKYLVCNKEGLPKGVNKDTMSEETSENQIRTGSTIWSLYLSLAMTNTESVTFGARMLSNETIKSYKWLLTCFLKAFNKQPRLVITDQDLAMRNVIASVFNESTHRLCMWHITNKLPLKICSKVLDNGTFRRRLHHLVWSLYIDPDEFEKKWHVLIEEFDLKENKWLSDMYNIRNQWIPAYFKDVELYGLIRTISRSESEIFFSNFTSGGSPLINFMMCFEAAMERQRHEQKILDNSTMQKIPIFKTKLPIERYAQKKYTKTMFTLIQEEINLAVFDFHQISESLENGIETITIKEIREIKVNTSRKKYNFGETSVQN